MEFTRKRKIGQMKLEKEICFNPCFNGIYSQTGIPVKRHNKKL